MSFSDFNSRLVSILLLRFLQVGRTVWYPAFLHDWNYVIASSVFFLRRLDEILTSGKMTFVGTWLVFGSLFCNTSSHFAVLQRSFLNKDISFACRILPSLKV